MNIVSRIRSKVIDDVTTMARFIRNIIIPHSPGFSLALFVMITVFVVRSVVGGYFIPQAIANVVNAVRRSEEELFFKRFVTGVGLFGAAAIVFIATEFALMRYFTKLADSIVSLKKAMLAKINENGNNEPLDDVIGRVSSDIDFVIWNINAVLTTLLPNVFTAVASTITIFSFNTSIGLAMLASSAPYMLLAEYYSRKAEVARLEERRAYSASIAYIRDALYERRNGDLLNNVFSWWRKSITNLIWFDRIYWGFGLFTQFSSAAAISYMSIEKARKGEIDVGTLAGIISAALGAHGAMLNAMWALCIQSQTVAAIKRVTIYFTQELYEAKRNGKMGMPLAKVIARALKI